MGKRYTFQQTMLAQLDRHMQKNKNKTLNSMEVPFPTGKGGSPYSKHYEIAKYMTPNLEKRCD